MLNADYVISAIEAALVYVINNGLFDANIMVFNIRPQWQKFFCPYQIGKQLFTLQV